MLAEDLQGHHRLPLADLFALDLKQRIMQKTDYNRFHKVKEMRFPPRLRIRTVLTALL